MMAGRRLIDLSIPAKRYRLDIHSRGFETVAAAKAEDRKRAKLLRKSAAQHGGEWGNRVRNLADQLDPDIHPEIPNTLASFRYVRRRRIQVIGNLWRMIDRYGAQKVRRCDVVKTSWSRDVAELGQQSAERLNAEFRSTLNRAGASKANGFLFAVLHGDFDPEKQAFHLHYHVVASPEMLAVVKAIRAKKRKGFFEEKAKRSTASVAQPVRISQRAMDDVPYALGYLLKSYWMQKSSERRNGQTLKKLRGRGKRIGEPFHSEYLLWLHQCDIKDLILMMGVRIGKDGFVVI